jgi:hypothetical protein
LAIVEASKTINADVDVMYGSIFLAPRAWRFFCCHAKEEIAIPVQPFYRTKPIERKSFSSGWGAGFAKRNQFGREERAQVTGND